MKEQSVAVLSVFPNGVVLETPRARRCLAWHSGVSLASSGMESFSNLSNLLLQLTEPISECLANAPCTTREGSCVAVKAILESLLPKKIPAEDSTFHASVSDFSLACALLSSSSFKPLTRDYSDLFSWIPDHLSRLGSSAFYDFSKAYLTAFNDRNSKRLAELGLNCDFVPREQRLMMELMPEVLLSLKDRIKESSIDKSDETDEFSAASARAPVVYAIAAAYQLRWFISQVHYPHLGKLCGLVIPSALTAVDHWSPEVKGQGMISFTHLAKNVDTTELGGYADVILDACCQNIAASDEIWCHVVETSVVFVTYVQRNNPRSPWYERILNEMLSHLERQPRNKERRIAWLEYVDSLFDAVALVLLAHFRRIFPLFFQWMHAEDDGTLILVLKRTFTILRQTWIRNSPYIERLVEELVLVYKEAALRKAREQIRAHTRQMLILLQQSKGLQFEAAWDKHRSDPDLSALGQPLIGRDYSKLDTMPAHSNEQSPVPLEIP
ncbi:uncharacterized protein At2g39910 [Neltuma alba]|uniref:uncharacterized protein At2g39910 n=1 Tax=Neltuma alba TaxID=207710 RepID=UPI0010A407BD|nr:uncharacterized protein At2g39910 [Prosopis alba]